MSAPQRADPEPKRKTKVRKGGWIEQEKANAKRMIAERAGELQLAAEREALSSPSSQSGKRRGGQRSRRRIPAGNKNMQILLAAQPMWPKMSKYTNAQRGKSRPAIAVNNSRRANHISKAKQRSNAIVSKPSFGSGEKRGIELLHKLRESSARPAPDGYQPAFGGSAMSLTGGKFNLSKSKSEVEWEIHRAKQLPGPGHSQPQGGYNCAELISGGAFNLGKPKSDIEWKIYRAAQVPAPGHSHPKCGYSAFVDLNGGKFNMSKPKSDVEWEIYRASQLPAPGEHHPSGGFNLLDNPVGKAAGGGKFNQSCAKSDIEWKMYYAAQIPGPSDTQPECGFTTMDSRGQSFNKGNSKGYVDWEIYRASQIPAPTSYEQDREFNTRTYNEIFKTQQEEALRKKALVSKTKIAAKRAMLIAAVGGGLFSNKSGSPKRANEYMEGQSAVQEQESQALACRSAR
jgi:hypothetical protein